jgi:hypothetical protein
MGYGGSWHAAFLTSARSRDRSRVDRSTDNLSLDTLSVVVPDDGEPALVPCRLEIVSPWYRRALDGAGPCFRLGYGAVFIASCAANARW